MNGMEIIYIAFIGKTKRRKTNRSKPLKVKANNPRQLDIIKVKTQKYP